MSTLVLENAQNLLASPEIYSEHIDRARKCLVVVHNVLRNVLSMRIVLGRVWLVKMIFTVIVFVYETFSKILNDNNLINFKFI